MRWGLRLFDVLAGLHVRRVGACERQRGDMADAAVGIGDAQRVAIGVGLGRMLAGIGFLLGMVLVLVMPQMRLGRRCHLMPAIRCRPRPGKLERQDQREEDEEQALHVGNGGEPQV